MADNVRKAFVLRFSRTFVNVVDYVSFPGPNTTPDLQSDLADKIKNPLCIFLDRHKMELFFLYREELARFEKDVDDKSFQELLESMSNDLKAGANDSQVLSYFLIVVAYFAALAKKNGLATALKTATLAIFDTIQHFESNGEEKNDTVAEIINSLVTTAERIESQKLAANERKTE